MLPTELLRVRRWRGRVQPLYISFERHGELCRTLIEVFEAHVGLKKAWLESKLEELESTQADFKLVRGLATLLMRRCVFRVKPNLPVEPKVARRVVFEEASLPPLSAEERAEVIARAASRLGVSPQALEEALWADSDSELVLESFVRPDPATLVAEYNLETARNLVSRALKLRVYSSSDWKRVFLLAKRFGLMYQASRDHRGFGLVVEGAQYANNSNAYADSMVSFFDGLLNTRGWRVVADVPSRGGRYTFAFELDSEEASKLGFGYVGVGGGQPSFDSEVERRFYYAFRSLNTGWEIEREPDPLLAGDEVFLPDFKLTRGGVSVYLEIVGFWTKEYLERKLKKLSQLRDVDMIVLADRSHSSTRLAEIPGVIFFEGDVPLKPILDILRRKQGGGEELGVGVGEALEELGDTVDVAELKKRFGSGYEREIARLVGAGYVQLGPILARRELVERAAAEIRSLGRLTYDAVEGICSRLGLPAQGLLEALGYRVKWLGLDPSKVVIEPAG